MTTTTIAITPAQMITWIHELGYEPYSYSGRAMYGAQCVGVNLERNESEVGFGAALMNVALEDGLAPAEREALLRTLKSAKMDSMGLGTVIYWPRIKWDAEVADDLGLHHEEGDDDDN